MIYDLVINRVCALSEATAKAVIVEDLEAKFREQVEAIQRSEELDQAFDSVLRIAQEAGAINASYLDPSSTLAAETENLKLEALRSDEHPQLRRRGRTPSGFVGLLPSRRLSVTAGGIDWIIRVRASATACALQDTDRSAKLWLTFEGVPADTDPDVRLTEREVGSFVGLTDAMATAAMPQLHEAYRRALQEIIGPAAEALHLSSHEVRIRMTDSNDIPVAALARALVYEGKAPSEIRHDGDTAHDCDDNDSRAAIGLKGFEQLVQTIVSEDVRVTDQALVAVDDVPGTRGFYWRGEGADGARTEIVGVARHAAAIAGYHLMSREQQRLEKEEDALRIRSAARPISAKLANAVASECDAAPH